MAKAVAASLNPDDLGGGGNIADGRYTITDAQVILMDTNRGEKCAVEFVLVEAGHKEGQSQRYTIGPSDKFAPWDGIEIVNPSGGDVSKISSKSNFGKFLRAIGESGFLRAELGSKVTCFNGADFDFENIPQPKMEGEDEKTLPLPVKYHGRAKPGRPTAPAKASTGRAPAQSTASSNGDTDDEAAIEFVKAALEGEESLSLADLGTRVWKGIMKGKDAGVKKLASDYKKLANNAEWLEEHAEEGGWLYDTDEETVSKMPD